MATATVETIKIVKLELSEDEAKWLKAVMQNPLVEDESPTEQRFRQLLFTALNGQI